MKRKLLDHAENIITGYAEWFIELIYIAHKKEYQIIEIPYVQKKDENLSVSKSYPNIFVFFYLGSTYLFRIILTIFRN